MANSITSGGIYYPPIWNGMPDITYGAAGLSFRTVGPADANAEKLGFFGRVFLNGRPGSKVLSSAGGKIHVRLASINGTALSVFGIGIQDISTAGTPLQTDGVFDVSTTITTSTVALVSNTWTTFTMTDGSKTLSHGELYGVVLDLSSRVSTDSINLAAIQAGPSAGIPFANNFVAAWGTTQGYPICILECDDGTLGWFANSTPVSSLSAQSITSAATNNEYGLRFSLPWTCTIDELGYGLRPGSSAADYTIILYADPDGTPVTVTAVVMDAAQSPTTGQQFVDTIPLQAPITITASTTYLLAAKANGTIAITIQQQQVADAAYKIAWSGGTTLASGARAGGAGAFSMVETNIPAGFFVRVNEIMASGGATVTATVTTTITTTITIAALKVHPGMGGGVRG